MAEHNIDRYHNKDIAVMAEKHKDLYKRANPLVAWAVVAIAANKAVANKAVAIAADKAAKAVYIAAAVAFAAAANKAGYNNNLAFF